MQCVIAFVIVLLIHCNTAQLGAADYLEVAIALLGGQRNKTFFQCFGSASVKLHAQSLTQFPKICWLDRVALIHAQPVKANRM